VQAALRPLAAALTDWIEQQRTTTNTPSKQQQATATELLQEASKQPRRIERGIEALENEQGLLCGSRLRCTAERTASHRRFQCQPAAPQVADNRCPRGGGKRIPARNAKATSKHEAHRQACIPPTKKSAPESNVPSSRPAALAM